MCYLSQGYPCRKLTLNVNTEKIKTSGARELKYVKLSLLLMVLKCHVVAVSFTL